MHFIIKRATTIVALLFFTCTLSSALPSSKSEGSTDIIDKAHNLLLQKNRQQALSLLSQTFRKEIRYQVSQEYLKVAGEIGEIFINDQAQQLYEAALSNLRSDINLALEKISEASKIESDNTLIANSFIRILIAKGDCASALDVAQKMTNFMWFSEDLKLALGQSLACQGKWSEVSKIIDLNSNKKSVLRKFWLMLEIEKLISSKNYSKAIENLGLVKKIDENYPEISYWNWKIQQGLKKNSHFWGRDYLAKCKNNSTQQDRQYLLDPLICRHIQEVTTELKGQNGTAD